MRISLNAKWPPIVASGLLLTLAFPKTQFSGIAWFALAPFLFALRGETPSAAFKAGILFGLTHYVTLLYWVVITMRTYGYLPWWQSLALLFLLAAYLSLYPGLFAMAVVRTCRQPLYLCLFAPALWVSFEFLRGFLFTGFPWGIVGYSQFSQLHLIQIADLFGVYGVSFVVVLFNAAVTLLVLFLKGQGWNGIRVGAWRAVNACLIALVSVGILFVYGKFGIASVEDAILGAPKPRVAVIQGNINQGIKWNPAFQIGTTKKYVQMTLSAASSQPELIVWPETATPFYFGTSSKLTQLVTDAAREAKVPLLVGSPSAEGAKGDRTHYNSAYMVGRDGKTTGRYDKVHLVPFGEYVPFKSLLSFAGKMVAQVGDFSAGEKGKTLSWKDELSPVGVQICFEIIFPGLSRALVNNGAGILVNLTNDAWFGRSAAAYQHFSMVVFRAVENRRSLVRCANTGISGFVDPAGRILERTELFEDAVIDRSVPILTEVTLYTRIGDLLPKACLLLLGVLLAKSVFYDRRKGDVHTDAKVTPP